MTVSVLDRPTLVLNRNWQPVNVATVARALTMLWNETAQVVDPDDYRLYTWADWSRLRPREDEPFLQAVTFRLRVPEILTLTRFDRPREEAVTFSRRNLFKRDHNTCQYCGAQPGQAAADPLAVGVELLAGDQLRADGDDLGVHSEGLGVRVGVTGVRRPRLRRE